MKVCNEKPGRALTFPPDYSRLVRLGKEHAVGYLLATSGDCLTLRDEEIRHIDRNLVEIGLDRLRTLRPEGSWILAVLLCPGDGTEALAAWAKALPGDEATRVVFYLAPGVDEAARSAVGRRPDSCGRRPRRSRIGPSSTSGSAATSTTKSIATCVTAPNGPRPASEDHATGGTPPRRARKSCVWRRRRMTSSSSIHGLLRWLMMSSSLRPRRRPSSTATA